MCTGAWQATLRHTHHLRDLALDAFTTRSEVAHIQTTLIFECAKGKLMPNYQTPAL